MQTSGPLDKPQHFALVTPSALGPVVDHLECYSWRSMLSLMTRWARGRCLQEEVSLWRKTRRGWVIEVGK